MPRISTYDLDNTLENTDKFLGSNSDGTVKNFKLSDVSAFLRATNSAGVGGQLTFVYNDADTVASSRQAGTITFDTGGASVVAFSGITAIKISKFPNGSTNSVVNLINAFLNTNIVIADTEDQDQFAVYEVTAIAQDSDETDFYDLSLTLVGSLANGNLNNLKSYSISITTIGSTGDITSVTAGTGLTGGGTDGAVTLNIGAGNLIDVQADQVDVDLSELTDMTQSWVTGEDEFVVLDNGTQKRKLSSEIFGSNAFTSTTIGTTTNALTVDNSSIQLNSGTTFDGSAARTISVKAGGITNAMLDGSIANDKLTNTSVSYGGVSLPLGGSDATPAFNLQDATGYPTSSLTGTITNSQLLGQIANDKLVNSSITIDGAAISLGGSVTTNNTQLTEEQVEDFVGGMVTGNTETGITVTYEDSDGTLDFVVADTTVAGDSGSTAITPGDTLTIAGGTNVTTAMSGDTLTITATDTNTQLSTEQVQDIVGAMFTGNTETRIAATYEDGDGTIDLVVTDMTANDNDDVSNANLLTRLAALESSGGSGDENITIGTDSGDTIVITGNLQVSGTTTTVNSTTVNLNDHNIVLDSGNSTSAVVNGAGITLEGGSGDDATFTYSTTGPKFELKLGSSYEDLQVDQLIAGSLDISGDVDVDGTLEADAITVNGTALNTVIAGVTVTNATNATNSSHVLVTDNESTDENNLITFVEGATSSTGNVGLEMDGNLTYNPSTGTVTATAFSGNLTGDVTGNVSGTAATVTGAAQSNITSLGTLTTLTVDNVIINGTTIGHTSTTNAITIGSDGEVEFTGANHISGASSLRAQAKSGNLFLDTSASAQIRTNGTTTALTLDTSQNATFAGKVQVAGENNSASTPLGKIANSQLHLDNTTHTNSISQIGFGYNSSTTFSAASIGFISTSQATNGKGDLFFATRDVVTDSVPTERLRISSAGNLGIGTTSPSSKLHVVDSSGGASIKIAGALTDTSAHYYGFMYDGTDLQGTTQVNLFYAGGAIKASTTITDFASFRIDAPSLSASGSAITNNYGIYQASTSQKNIFSGITGIGSTGIYAGTNAILNLQGSGIALKNDRNGSSNNWSYIQNDGTGNEATIIFSTGQVSSAMKLAHNGVASFKNYLSIDPAVSAGTSSFIEWKNDSSLFAYIGSAAAILSGGAAADYVAGNTTTNASVFLSTNNTERLKIVGSGEATFTAPNNSDTLTIKNTGTYGGTIAFTQGASTNVGYVGSIRALEGNASADNGIGLFSRSRIGFYTDSSTPDVTISSAGKVGIGDTAPDGMLDVVGDMGTSANALVRLRSTNTTARTTRLQLEDYSGAVADALIDFVIPNAGSAVGSYLGMGVNGTTALVTTVNGNLGIGLTDPESYYAEDLVVSCANEGGITLKSAAGENAWISFADGTGSGNPGDLRGHISYHHSSDLFNIGGQYGNYRIQINAAGKTTISLLHVGFGTHTANALGDDFVVDPGIASAGMSIISTNSSDTSTGLSFIALGDSANTAIASVSYAHSDNSFSIISNDGAALSINSSRVVSGDLNDTSDVALKKDIVSLGDSIEIMKQLNPVSFYWKDSVKGNTKNIGFVAQEVETILPEVVFGEDYSVNEQGHVSAKSVNTTGIVALLTKAVQEQQAQIELLKQEVELLKNK